VEEDLRAKKDRVLHGRIKERIRRSEHKGNGRRNV